MHDIIHIYKPYYALNRAYHASILYNYKLHAFNLCLRSYIHEYFIQLTDIDPTCACTLITTSEMLRKNHPVDIRTRLEARNGLLSGPLVYVHFSIFTGSSHFYLRLLPVSLLRIHLEVFGSSSKRLVQLICLPPCRVKWGNLERPSNSQLQVHILVSNASVNLAFSGTWQAWLRSSIIAKDADPVPSYPSVPL